MGGNSFLHCNFIILWFTLLNHEQAKQQNQLTGQMIEQ